MERYQEIKRINEGINDKNLFKAVFLIGGAGSGKGYISQLIFGFNNKDWISPHGIKVINSDIIFESKLKKLNLSFIIKKEDEGLYKKQQEVRDLAKALTTSKAHHYIDGMLPLLIDGTGRKFEKLTSQAEALKNIGYDVDIIFVNTSMETALERNEKRARTVDSKVVKEMHKAIQQNIGKFQHHFGNDHFFIVDNDTYFEPKSKQAKSFENSLFKLGNKIISKPLKNKIGINVIDTLKRLKGKNLSDLEDIVAKALVV